MRLKFTVLFLAAILSSVNIVYSQTPAYNLSAMNFVKTSSNSFVFDIYIQHTNAPVYFEYSGGQYFFDINPAIANGGTLSYTYTGPDTSDLPVNLRPRNPQVNGTQLRLATNTFPAAGSGFILTNNGSPGTKIIRMKVATTASSFAYEPLNFLWRNESPDPFTKIFAFVATENLNITTPSSHSVDSISLNGIPKFNIIARNFKRITLNILEFEIDIKHTNNPVMFEYSGGQYFFDFNPAIANGGTLTYTYANDTSQLPLNLRPRNPQISGSELRLATNTFPSAGNGFIMTNNNSPGTKVVRVRLTTTATTFANVPLNLKWRTNGTDPFTKVFAFTGIIGTSNTNVSSTASYSIDSSLIYSTYNIKVAVEGLYRTIQNKHIRKDIISASLRSTISPYQLVDSSTAILDSNTLTASFLFSIAPAGKYYIVLKYKNSIDTWSKTGGDTLIYSGINNYDFTTSLTKAYGNNMILKGSKYCIYSGDVNASNFIDISDMSKVENDAYLYLSGDVVSDLNGDRSVDLDDLSIVDNNLFNYVGTIRP